MTNRHQYQSVRFPHEHTRRSPHVSIFDLMGQLHDQGIEEAGVDALRPDLSEVIQAPRDLIQAMMELGAQAPLLRIAFKSSREGMIPLLGMTMNSHLWEIEPQEDILEIARLLRLHGVSNQTLVLLLPEIWRVFTVLEGLYQRLKEEGFTARIRGSFAISGSSLHIPLEPREIAAARFSGLSGINEEFAPHPKKETSTQTSTKGAPLFPDDDSMSYFRDTMVPILRAAFQRLDLGPVKVGPLTMRMKLTTKREPHEAPAFQSPLDHPDVADLHRLLWELKRNGVPEEWFTEDNTGTLRDLLFNLGHLVNTVSPYFNGFGFHTNFGTKHVNTASFTFGEPAGDNTRYSKQ